MKRYIVFLVIAMLFISWRVSCQDYSNLMPVAIGGEKPTVAVRCTTLRDLCGYDYSGVALPFEMFLSNYYDMNQSHIHNNKKMVVDMIVSIYADIEQKGYTVLNRKRWEKMNTEDRLQYLLDLWVCCDKDGYIIPFKDVTHLYPGNGGDANEYRVIGNHPEKTVFHYDVD